MERNGFEKEKRVKMDKNVIKNIEKMREKK